MSLTQPGLDALRIERAPPARPRRALFRWIAVAAVVLALAVLGWWWTRRATVPVRTAVARELAPAAANHTILNASGYVTARRAATVSSKVVGKVLHVSVEEGLRVQEGQVLARLDDSNAQAMLHLSRAQLDAAKSALAETRVRLKEAEQEWQRQTALMKGGVAAAADYDRAEAAALALRARLTQQQAEIAVAERSVAVAEQQADDTVIRAPFGGIVTSKNAQPGEMISPMSAGGFTRTGICTIVDMESLEIEIDVNESYINRVEPGQAVTATLDAYPDWKIGCKVIAIIPTADRQKSTVKVRVGFDRLDPRILPEMSVKVAFRDSSPVAAARRAVAIPKAAIRHDNERDFVFVLHAGRTERRAVTVTASEQAEALVSAGVAAGEKVIIEAPAALGDGARVKEIHP